MIFQLTGQKGLGFLLHHPQVLQCCRKDICRPLGQQWFEHAIVAGTVVKPCLSGDAFQAKLFFYVPPVRAEQLIILGITLQVLSQFPEKGLAARSLVQFEFAYEGVVDVRPVEKNG
jgi:hypothetical protein